MSSSNLYYGGSNYPSRDSTIYDNLDNKPIIVLTGTSTNPIVFADLDYGYYTFTGYYKYNSSYTAKSQTDIKNLIVFANGSLKTIKYEYVSDGNHYTKIINFASDNTYTEENILTSDTDDIIALLVEEVSDTHTDMMGETHGTLQERLSADFAGEYRPQLASYEGKYITATNTSEGYTVDSVIEGKTYHNLARLDLPSEELFSSISPSDTFEDKIITINADGNNRFIQYNYNKQMYKPNTKYTIIFNVLENTINKDFYLTQGNSGFILNFANGSIITATTGVYKFCIISQDDVSGAIGVFRSFLLGGATEGTLKFTFAIYEGDLTNVDLPPTITGIESVESPVIKSVGKNLFDENSDNAIIDSSNTYGYFDLGLDKNKTYMMTLTEKDSSIDISSMYFGWTEYGSGFLERDSTKWIVNNGIFMINNTNLSDRGNSCKYLSFYPNNLTTIEAILNRYNIQVELGSTATAYEPYVEDSVSYSDITLMGIGDKYDYIETEENRIVRYISSRDYVEGDLDLTDVLVNEDLSTTYYILSTPIYEVLTMSRELKTYDGTTHLLTEGSNISPNMTVRMPLYMAGAMKSALEDITLMDVSLNKVKEDILEIQEYLNVLQIL